MAEIKFKAAVHAVRIDHDGEVKVTFTVPLIHRDSALLLGALTETYLLVTVGKDPDQGQDFLKGAGEDHSTKTVEIPGGE